MLVVIRNRLIDVEGCGAAQGFPFPQLGGEPVQALLDAVDGVRAEDQPQRWVIGVDRDQDGLRGFGRVTGL